MRDAGPIFVPEVPDRLPAASWAHVTKQQEDTKFCTRGEASDVMHFLPEHEPEALANAWDGLEPIQGVGIMRLVRRDNGQCQIPEQRIIGPTQSKVDFCALSPGRIRNPSCNPVTGGLIGELRADLGQIVLNNGRLAGHASTAQPGGASDAFAVGAGRAWPACRRDARTPAATCPPQEHRNFWGVDRVVFGLAAMEGFH